jgi:hypothetical protein
MSDEKRPRGRPKGQREGVPTRAIASLAELARRHTDKAVATLAYVCEFGESEAARVAAANHLLDRAYGKPQQSVDHTTDGKAMLPYRIEIVAVNDDNGAS